MNFYELERMVEGFEPNIRAGYLIRELQQERTRLLKLLDEKTGEYLDLKKKLEEELSRGLSGVSNGLKDDDTKWNDPLNGSIPRGVKLKVKFLGIVRIMEYEFYERRFFDEHMKVSPLVVDGWAHFDSPIEGAEE